MIRFFIKLLLMALAVLLLGNVLPGASISNYTTAIWVALVLGVLNVLVKPLLQLISLPITIITLGLFLFVINAFIILMASSLVNGFSVNGFLSALLFSLCLSILQSVIDNFLEE